MKTYYLTDIDYSLIDLNPLILVWELYCCIFITFIVSLFYMTFLAPLIKCFAAKVFQ